MDDATQAFVVAVEILGMDDVALRSGFLIADGETVKDAWMLRRELPDIDAVIATAQSN